MWGVKFWNVDMAIGVRQMSMIATPFLGAFGGGGAVNSRTDLGFASGVVVGFSIGIGLIALERFLLFRILPRIEKSKNAARYQTTVMVTVMLVLPMVLLFLAFWLSHVVVSAGLHL
jgi:hypothetical protein